MDEILPENENIGELNALSENDIEKYAKNLSEYHELKILESQFNDTATELNEAKNQLSNVEKEIKILQEEKMHKEKKCEELLFSAKKYLENENYNEALDAYYEILEITPKHIRALAAIHKIKKEIKEKENEKLEKEQKARKKAEEALNFFESGKRFYRMSNYEKALDEFLTAVSVNGKNPEIMGYIEKCEQKILEIEETMNIAKKENENKRKTISELSLNANSYLRKKEFAKGIELLEKALLIMPDNLEIKESLKHADLAYNEYNNQMIIKKKEDEALELEKHNSKIQMLNNIANDFFSKGYYERALTYYEEILSIEPKDINAKAGIYKCNTEMKKEEDIKKNIILEEERKKKEELIRVIEKGKHYFKIESYEKALCEFIFALSLDINNKDAMDLKEKCEQKILAAEELRLSSVKEQEQKNKTVNELFVRANAHIRKNEYETGIELLEKALLIMPDNLEIKESLKHADLALNEYKKQVILKHKADEILALEKNSAKIQVINNIANDFFSQGYYQKALSYYEEIISIDPTNVIAESGIYRCSTEMRKEEELKKNVIIEQEKKMKIEEACFSSKIFLEENNYEEALKKLEYALSLDSYNEDIKKNILAIKKELKEIAFYEGVKNNVLLLLKTEEKKINDLKHKIDSGMFLFVQKRYDDALKMWEGIYLKSLSEGEH